MGYKEVVLTSAIVSYANPTKELLREAEEVFGAEAEVATVLSIGAGSSAIGIGSGEAKGARIADSLLQGALSSKQVHEEIQMRLGETRVYFRFSIDHGLVIEPTVVSAQISGYLNERAVTTRLDDAIKSLGNRPKGLLLKDISRFSLS